MKHKLGDILEYYLVGALDDTEEEMTTLTLKVTSSVLNRAIESNIDE